MATRRDIRRLAFQGLYILDARDGTEPEALHALLSDPDALTDADAPGEASPGTPFSAQEVDRACRLAIGAHEHRAEADAEMATLAPEWPAHRQPAVDRAILRLAHHEMTRTDAQPKAVINDAVELAKAFSTDRSPPFINALLDKVLKRLSARADAPQSPPPGNDPPGGTSPGSETPGSTPPQH